MTKIIKSIPTLKGKEANEFAKRMLDEEIKTLKSALSYGLKLKQTPKIKETNKAIRNKIKELEKEK